MAGYSNTPLIKKLGIIEEMKVKVINQPKDYFSLLDKNINFQFCKPNEKADLIHLFVSTKKEFEIEMRELKVLMKPTTIIWVSWYKKSSGIKTDVSENDIRDYALKHDLVDVKVCAVSDVWSGLKLVVPLAKR